jgi:DNA-directed RNA polymerase subunit RPC12/RpoP
MGKITRKLLRLKCKECSFDQELTCQLESRCLLTTCPHCFSKDSITIKSSDYACPTCNHKVRVMLINEDEKTALCKCDRCQDASEVVFAEPCEEVV